MKSSLKRILGKEKAKYMKKLYIKNFRTEGRKMSFSNKKMLVRGNTNL